MTVKTVFLFCCASFTNTFIFQNHLQINIIRDPIEQFISNYYYIRNGFVNENRVKGWELDHLLTPGTKNESLKTCIKLVKLAELDNIEILRDCKKVYSDMIPFFCGSHQWCRKRDAAALEQAKNNIRKYSAIEKHEKDH